MIVRDPILPKIKRKKKKNSILLFKFSNTEYILSVTFNNVTLLNNLIIFNWMCILTKSLLHYIFFLYSQCLQNC